MKNSIIQLLRDEKSLSARRIAKAIDKSKTQTNSFLYKNTDLFKKDDNHLWSLVREDKVCVEFSGQWITCESFETSLQTAGDLFTHLSGTVVFIVKEDSRLLLEALARLLALCNQLAQAKKNVILDFSIYSPAFSYLDRMGFFDHLNGLVRVLPLRPEESRAKKYEGNSDAVVEFRSLCPNDRDERIPKILKECFIAQAGAKYSSAVFTVITELFGNVYDHSETKLPGFVAFQKYRGRRHHLQTVVSDSGRGIAGTLMPILEEHYPELNGKYSCTNPKAKIFLIKDVLEKGGISQTGTDGRGLGLSRSKDCAVKYEANISIRQENFELLWFYGKGVGAEFTYRQNLHTIHGTQVCFDLYLDESSQSR